MANTEWRPVVELKGTNLRERRIFCSAKGEVFEGRAHTNGWAYPSDPHLNCAAPMEGWDFTQSQVRPVLNDERIKWYQPLPPSKV